MTLKKKFSGESSNKKPTQAQIDNFVIDAVDGNKEGVRHFCQTFPGYIDAPNSDGDTALAAAAEKNQTDTGTLLLYAGANPNLPAKDGASPFLRWVMTIRPVAEQKDMRLLEAMLAHEADVNARQRGTGMSALMFYPAFSNEKLCKYLLKAGADVTLTDDGGRTARHYAVDMSNQVDCDSSVDDIDGKYSYSALKKTIDSVIRTLDTAEKDRKSKKSPRKMLATAAIERANTLS